MPNQIALLHPGEMGVTVGACASKSGISVAWTSSGRSQVTRGRASGAGFKTYDELGALLGDSNIVLSVCPPAEAINTATDVAAANFAGIYVDANAISPNSAVSIAEIVETAGASYVDGGIIGPPAHREGTTRLYLSGERTSEVINFFSHGALEPIDIGKSQTAASALKMCYAAWTKGSTALLLAVGALALSENIAAALRAEWDKSLPDLLERLDNAARRNSPKAWRFEGEMHEIANTFADNRLPSGFHQAAAETYALLSQYKDRDKVPELDEILRTMLELNNE